MLWRYLRCCAIFEWVRCSYHNYTLRVYVSSVYRLIMCKRWWVHITINKGRDNRTRMNPLAIHHPFQLGYRNNNNNKPSQEELFFTAVTGNTFSYFAFSCLYMVIVKDGRRIVSAASWLDYNDAWRKVVAEWIRRRLLPLEDCCRPRPRSDYCFDYKHAQSMHAWARSFHCGAAAGSFLLVRRGSNIWLTSVLSRI